MAVRVGWRLVVLGLALAAVSALIRLWFDYNAETRGIADSAHGLFETHRYSLERSLWTMDREQLSRELGGMMALPYLVRVEVTEATDVSGRVALVVGKEPEAGQSRRFDFTLTQPDSAASLGIFSAVFDLRQARNEVLRRVGVVALTQVVFVGLILWLVMLILRKHVTADLETLARRVRGFDWQSERTSFALQRPASTSGDEIDQVIGALASMQGRLRESYMAQEAQRRQLEEDVRARERAEAAAEYLSKHDPLTELPNRRLFAERFDSALKKCEEHGQPGALVFIDIDHFRHWNDTRGHTFGDTLLKHVSDVIRRELPEGATLARVGGDEFLLLLPGLPEGAPSLRERTETYLAHLQERVRRPVDIDGERMQLTLTMGAVLYPDHGLQSASLISYADAASLQAKLTGRDTVCFFETPMLAKQEQRSQLELTLREAIVGSEFVVYYQPIMNAEERLRSAEALVRWRKPDGTLVSPADFIAVCERSGMIVELGRWVQQEVIRQIKSWGEKSLLPGELRIAINVSARQFVRADFAPSLLDGCHQAAVSPTRITIELTEGLFLENLESASDAVSLLQKAGVRFDLDDFGTGFSSLAYLRKLPIDGLKIDRTFIADAPVDGRAAGLVDAIVDIARQFELDVTAEGVESPAHQEFLRPRGVHAYQGYLYSRPLPGPEFEAQFLRPRMTANA